MNNNAKPALFVAVDNRYRERMEDFADMNPSTPRFEVVEYPHITMNLHRFPEGYPFRFSANEVFNLPVSFRWGRMDGETATWDGISAYGTLGEWIDASLHETMGISPTLDEVAELTETMTSGEEWWESSKEGMYKIEKII